MRERMGGLYGSGMNYLDWVDCILGGKKRRKKRESERVEKVLQLKA